MRDALGSVRSVCVLGGTSDIGRAIARALVARGAAEVVLAGRRPDALAAAADELRDAGTATVETVPFDAADTSSHQGLVARLFAERDLDVVVLAFGVLGDQEVAARDHAAACEIATTNYLATVSVGIPLAEALRAQGHGTLVVLSSIAAVRARPSNWVYGSSKAGQDAVAEGLSHHLAGSGARVVTVRPGFVHTKMTAALDPAPFATDADTVAAAVADAIRTGREVVWVPPVLRVVAAALRLLPRPLLRRAML